MLKILKRIIDISGKNKKNLYLALVLSFFEGIVLKVPLLCVLFALIKITSVSLTIESIKIISIILFASLALGIILRFLIDSNQMGCGYEIFSRHRISFGDKLKRFPMGFFDESNIGNSTSVVTSDITFIEEFGMNQLGHITTSIVAMLATLVMLTIFSFKIGLIVFVSLFIIVLLFNKAEKITKEHSFKNQQCQSEVIEKVIEFIKGMAVVKAFNLVDERQKSTTDVFEKFRDVQTTFEKKCIVPMVIIEIIIALGIGTIIFTSGTLLINNSLNAAYAIMFMIFSFETFGPIKVLVGIAPEIRVMEAALDRYEKLLNVDLIDDNSSDVTIKDHDIEFKNVTFKYNEKPVIRNMSFKIKEKTLTALVGKSGCGKTTITSLIARFYDVQEGTVSIGGVDVKNFTCESLLKNISMVFQDVYLFNDTVFNNIAFGNPNATKQEVMKAVKEARCFDFVERLPDGFDTVLKEGGASLSGGEKQRISIARAILKDAPIILLDEATSSIDPDNEEFIQEALNKLVKNKTLIVIAHKLSSIKNADNIIVIDEGELVQQGVHETLVNEEGLYKSLWNKRQKSNNWQLGRK